LNLLGAYIKRRSKMQMTNEQYEIRPFRKGDEEAILNLWQAAFNSTMSLPLFRWKYLENPYSQAMMLSISNSDGVVAFYGGVPYLFHHEDRDTHAVQLMDIMTHPDHRKNKVFVSTAKEFMSLYCASGALLLMYGFPGEFHYGIGEKKLNYEKMGRVLHLKYSLKELSGHTGKVFSNHKVLSSPDEYPDPYLDPVSMESINSVDAHSSFLNHAWNKNRRDYCFSIVRDAAFVKWRFFDHPEKEYKVLKFTGQKSNGDLNHGQTINLTPGMHPDTDLLMDADFHNKEESLSWVVIKLEGKKAILVDMLMPNSFPHFKGVFAALEKYLMEMGIDEVVSWLPENHFSAKYALLAGFRAEQEPLGIVSTVARFDHSPSIGWLESNFYYSMVSSTRSRFPKPVFSAL